MIFYDLHKSVI